MLEAQKVAHRVEMGPVQVMDLIGSRFYSPSMGNVHFEFSQEGHFLVANERFGDGKPYGIYNDLVCGRINTIYINHKFRCSGATSKIFGDVYVDVDVRKPENAPLYMDLFLGPNVGSRPGWVREAE